MKKRESYDEMMLTLRAEYLKAMPGRLALLQSLTETSSWDQLSEEYHKIKGTGSTYGFPEITTLCETMEEICRAKELRTAEHLTAGLELLNYLVHIYLAGETPELMKQAPARKLWPDSSRT